MRTVILALAVVLLAAPAWAAVTITLTDLGDHVSQRAGLCASGNAVLMVL